MSKVPHHSTTSLVIPDGMGHAHAVARRGHHRRHHQDLVQSTPSLQTSLLTMCFVTNCMQLDAANATCARLRHDLDVSRSHERELHTIAKALQEKEEVIIWPGLAGAWTARH